MRRKPETTYARLRLSSAGNLGIGGAADDGDDDIDVLSAALDDDTIACESFFSVTAWGSSGNVNNRYPAHVSRGTLDFPCPCCWHWRSCWSRCAPVEYNRWIVGRSTIPWSHDMSKAIAKGLHPEHVLCALRDMDAGTGWRTDGI